MLLLSIYGGSMVLSVILNLLFVPTFGYVAAAIVTVMGEAGVVILTALATKKTLGEFLERQKSMVNDSSAIHLSQDSPYSL